MNPTQYELAMIAAHMPTATADAAQAARQALTLWEACGDELSRRESRLQRQDAWLEADRKWMAFQDPAPEKAGTVKFAVFLREIDSKAKTSTLTDRLRRYIVEAHRAHYIVTGQWMEASRMEELAGLRIAAWKKHGLKVEEAVKIEPRFRSFILSDAKELRRARASKGGEGRAARKSQTPAKKEKSPNTKKTLEPGISPRSKAKATASRDYGGQSAGQARKWVSKRERSYPAS